MSLAFAYMDSDFTVENLCGFLIRSKLLSPDEVKAAYQRWSTEARDKVGVSSLFMRWLVAGRLLTEYQANLLAKGHADDFFLDQYKIVDRLGRGRMAGVYKATHGSGQIVAIKVLPPSRSKNAQLLARFQREAQLALKLKHPNVVRSFQVGERNGLHYLVMEYLEGETIDEVMQRRKRLPPSEAVRLVHQALMGLQYIHESGMVHRDLKPANLMLVPARQPNEPDTTLRATVKVLDIGLGRNLFEESASAGELTAEGVLLGTPDYLAPEQARDARSIDIRADIYSLGCVLYHTLTGQPPFPDTNILNQMVRHATETPRALKDFNPSIPDGLQQIVNWMMAKKPEQRYPTPERAAQALQVFLMADAEPAKTPPPMDDTPKKNVSWLNEGIPMATPAPPTPTPPPRAKATPAPPTREKPRETPPPVAKELPREKAKKKPATEEMPKLDVDVDVEDGDDEDLDVELVASGEEEEEVVVAAPKKKGKKGASLLAKLGIQTRDWIFMGIGAALMFVVWLLVWLYLLKPDAPS